MVEILTISWSMTIKNKYSQHVEMQRAENLVGNPSSGN